MILGIFIPPYAMALEFKTKEELQLMPQTMEEHLEELEDDDSDTEDLSFSSLDDDNVHEVHSGGNWHSASSLKSYPSFKPFLQYFFENQLQAFNLILLLCLFFFVFFQFFFKNQPQTSFMPGFFFWQYFLWIKLSVCFPYILEAF